MLLAFKQFLCIMRITFYSTENWAPKTGPTVETAYSTRVLENPFG
jgi:hypothetical protein